MATSTLETTSPPSEIAVSVDMTCNEMDDASSIPPQYPSNRASYLKLFTNGLFNSRIIILWITIFLFLLSLSYAFGQILSIELSDFWCGLVTIDEIRVHSRQMNSNEGDPHSCWNTNQNTVKNNNKFKIEHVK